MKTDHEIEIISLRPALEGDEGFLRFVYADSRRAELDQAVWPEGVRETFLRSQFDAQAAHYKKHYPDSQFLIVERESRPVGRLYIWRTAAEIRIMDLAIIGEFRGQGIGTTLLTRLLDEGREAGRKVTIHVEKFNPALRLNERLGFRIVADLEVYWFLEWSPAAAS